MHSDKSTVMQLDAMCICQIPPLQTASGMASNLRGIRLFEDTDGSMEARRSKSFLLPALVEFFMQEGPASW
jgi:hypothetical protein